MLRQVTTVNWTTERSQKIDIKYGIPHAATLCIKKIPNCCAKCKIWQTVLNQSHHKQGRRLNFALCIAVSVALWRMQNEFDALHKAHQAHSRLFQLTDWMPVWTRSRVARSEDHWCKQRFTERIIWTISEGHRNKGFISMCNSCSAFCSDDALCEQVQETSDGNLYVRGHGNYEGASVCIAGHPQCPILAFNSKSLSVLLRHVKAPRCAAIWQSWRWEMGRQQTFCYSIEPISLPVKSWIHRMWRQKKTECSCHSENNFIFSPI